MISVLIPEKIPAHNKGEEAILIGICKTIEIIDDYKIYLYSESPEYDSLRYVEKAEIITESLIPNSELSWKDKLSHLIRSGSKHLLFLMTPSNMRKKLFRGQLWQIYNDVDLIILGHDNAFSFTHNFMILFGKLLGKKVVMYGASILPYAYEKAITKYVTKYCLEKLDLITLRESKSQKFLEDIGIDRSHLHVTADKAFLLDPIEKDQALAELKNNGIDKERRPLIGMTVVYGSGVFRKGLINYKDPIEKYTAFTDAMVQVVDFLVKDLDATVVFMPHTIGPAYKEDDRNVADEVLKKVENKSNIFAIKGDYSASELKGMIGCCDFFIGARTHSVIAATSMSVPSIVLTFSQDLRTHGIIGDMLGQGRWMYNIDYLKGTEVIELVKAAWSVKDDTKKKLPDIIKKTKERALLNGKLLKEALDKK